MSDATKTPHDLGYTIPGALPGEGRTSDLADAVELATRVARRTGYHAAVVAHHWTGSVEEVRLVRWVPDPAASPFSHPVVVVP